MTPMKLIFCLLLFYLSLLLINTLLSSRIKYIELISNSIQHHSDNSSTKVHDVFDFEGFDNRENGSSVYIVPNTVNLLYLNTSVFKFYQVVCIYSIYLNQKPDVIYLHCDTCNFHGHYWDQMNSISDLKKRFRINKLEFHDTIFGVKYGWVNHHRSDVYRLLALANFGGMYFDTDVYVINSLDKYRKFEMTLSLEGNNLTANPIGNQVLLANRNARLLRPYLDAFRYIYLVLFVRFVNELKI
jgi:hypothetical protein